MAQHHVLYHAGTGKVAALSLDPFENVDPERGFAVGVTEDSQGEFFDSKTGKLRPQTPEDIPRCSAIFEREGFENAAADGAGRFDKGDGTCFVALGVAKTGWLAYDSLCKLLEAKGETIPNRIKSFAEYRKLCQSHAGDVSIFSDR